MSPTPDTTAPAITATATTPCPCPTDGQAVMDYWDRYWGLDPRSSSNPDDPVLRDWDWE